MSFFATVVRKLNTPTVASKLQILSVTSKHYSTTTGYTQEEIEKFRKFFRIVPSYEESIASKDIIPYLKSIGYIKNQEAYDKYIEFTDKILNGRIELIQIVKYLQAQHDPSQLMNEFAITFDKDKDGYITKEEFEYGIQTLKIHDPRVKVISFATFLKEADANKDGRISVSELKDWLINNIGSYY